MQQIIKTWFALLPSNSSLLIKRAEQPQTLILGVILTSISLDDSEPLLILCIGLVAASFCRFFGVYMCVHAVCYGALSKDTSLPII